MKMLNIRKCLTVASPLKNCVLFSSTIRPSKKPAHLNSRGQTKRRPQTRFGPNPGVQLQMSALQQNEKDISNPDFLEDMEKQFWDVDKIQDVVDRYMFMCKRGYVASCAVRIHISVFCFCMTENCAYLHK